MHVLGAGSAVLLLNNRNGKPHVWFILTDPDASGKVLAVMLRTRRRHTDDTVILKVGEYEFGNPNAEGAIDYGQATLFPIERLANWIRDGRAQLRSALSQGLLVRVRNGLNDSGHTPNWVMDYLGD